MGSLLLLMALLAAPASPSGDMQPCEGLGGARRRGCGTLTGPKLQLVPNLAFPSTYAPSGFLSGTKGERITTTRAAPKYCVTTVPGAPTLTGAMVVLPPDTPCVQNASGTSAGLRIEKDTENKAPFSADLLNPLWTKSGVSVVGGQPDPLGGNNAFQLTTTATGGAVFISVPIGVATSAFVCWTWWMVIPSGTRTVALGIYDLTLNNGSFFSRRGYTATAGWLPQNQCVTGAIVGHSYAAYFYPASTTPAVTGFVATIFAPMFEWGVSSAGSYAPTPSDGGTALRPGEVVSSGAVTLSGTPSMAFNYHAPVSTVGGTTPAVDQYLMGAQAPEGNFQVWLRGSDSKIECDLPGGGTVVTASAVAYNATHRVSCNYNGTSLSLCVDGVCATSAATAPTATSYTRVVYGGNGDTTKNLQGYFYGSCLDGRLNKCL